MQGDARDSNDVPDSSSTAATTARWWMCLSDFVQQFTTLVCCHQCGIAAPVSATKTSHAIDTATAATTATADTTTGTTSLSLLQLKPHVIYTADNML